MKKEASGSSSSMISAPSGKQDPQGLAALDSNIEPPVLRSRSVFDRLRAFFRRLRLYLLQKVGIQKCKKMFTTSHLRNKKKFFYFKSICFLINLLSMLERTKRISFRISSVSSKVEPDLHFGSGSSQNLPAPAPQHCINHIVIVPFPKRLTDPPVLLQTSDITLASHRPVQTWQI